MAERSRSAWLTIAFAGLAAIATGSACTRQGPPNIPDPVSRASDPWPLGAGCVEQPDPHCNNLVNRALVPMLRGANIEIRDESKSELCRRMALDLIGRTP